MNKELSGRFFGFLGITIGTLIGLVISNLQSNPLVALTGFFLNGKILLILVLLYLALQLTLGVSLKRPTKSRALYFGMPAIPVAYALFMNYPLGMSLEFYPAYFAIVVFLFEIPIVYIMAIGIFIGRSIRFFTGLNRRLLSDGSLDSRAIFNCELEFVDSDKVDTGLMDRINRLSGFPLLKARSKDSSQRAIYHWRGSCLGSSWDRNGNKINLVLAEFCLCNDTVQDPSNIENVLDFQAEVHGLLSSWEQRRKIVRFTILQPNSKTLEGISDLLGKWELPSRKQIYRLIAENISKSKVLTWLIATIVGGAILLSLDKIVAIFWH